MVTSNSSINSSKARGGTYRAVRSIEREHREMGRSNRQKGAQLPMWYQFSVCSSAKSRKPLFMRGGSISEGGKDIDTVQIGI